MAFICEYDKKLNTELEKALEDKRIEVPRCGKIEEDNGNIHLSGTLPSTNGSTLTTDIYITANGQVEINKDIAHRNGSDGIFPPVTFSIGLDKLAKALQVIREAKNQMCEE